MNPIKRGIAAISAMLMVLVLSACDKDEPSPPSAPPKAVAIVYGAHSNGAKIDMEAPDGGFQQEWMELVDEGQAKVTVIVPDSQPHTSGSIDLEVSDDLTPSQKNAKKKANGQALWMALNEATADDPEIDILTALSLAAGAVEGADDQTIIVVDSGLSTAGTLQLTTGIPNDPQGTAELHNAANTLPKLDGIDVVWYGIGDLVSKPQSPLDSGHRNKLEDLWRETLTTAGAETVEFKNSPIPTLPEVPTDLPKVAMVPIDAREPTATEPTINIDENLIGFEGGTANYLDENKAKDVLTVVVRRLEEDHAKTTSVTGCVANAGDTIGQLEVSEARANKVADTLKQLGWTGPITTRGLGIQCPGHTPDVNVDGSLNEIAAVNNRRVIIDWTT